VKGQDPAAQHYFDKRTPWGDPDLQGIWDGTTPTPFERPAELRGVAEMSSADAQERLRGAIRRREEGPPREGTGSYNAFWREYGAPLTRTSLITDPADGSMPPLTAEGQKRVRHRESIRDRPPENPEDRSLNERCISDGPLNFNFHGGFPRIVQAPGFVVIAQLRMHETRIIPLDGRPYHFKDVRQWIGESRGRWDRNTLVVTTKHYRTGMSFSNGSGALQEPTENLEIVERFTRVDDNTINYEVTINDPAMWTRPWTAAFPLRNAFVEFGPSAESGVSEYACHEGNYSMIGQLGGARVQEKAAGQNRSTTPSAER
jgi:hypothetical protein